MTVLFILLFVHKTILLIVMIKNIQSTHKIHSRQVTCLATMVWLLRQRCLCSTWPVVGRKLGMWPFLKCYRICTILVTTLEPELGATPGGFTPTWRTRQYKKSLTASFTITMTCSCSLRRAITQNGAHTSLARRRMCWRWAHTLTPPLPHSRTSSHLPRPEAKYTINELSPSW